MISYKTAEEIVLHFVPQNEAIGIDIIGGISEIAVAPQTVAEGALFLTMHNEDIEKLKTTVAIDVVSGDEIIEEIETMDSTERGEGGFLQTGQDHVS